jgi:hypothetical protein
MWEGIRAPTEHVESSCRNASADSPSNVLASPAGEREAGSSDLVVRRDRLNGKRFAGKGEAASDEATEARSVCSHAELLPHSRRQIGHPNDDTRDSNVK